MLLLLETAAGFAIFKFLGDEERLERIENVYSDFSTLEALKEKLKLTHFERFDNTTVALEASRALLEGKLSKLLKKTLKKCNLHSEKQKLAVADIKLGKAIAEKLNFSCIATSPIQELMRCVRFQLHSFLDNVNEREMTAMRLGLAHSLSRYKIKFSSEKIDTMVIQSICVLDDLDKQINNYIMRAREWFGWHFPELGKIVKDNMSYIKTMKVMGLRDNVTTCDLSEFLSEDILKEVKEAAETSMGSEITEYDAEHMRILCGEILELDQYRADLKSYLTVRMMSLAPNLTILVGDIVGARLISKAGSLKNLAKHPASTLQILGAEKALFRALKARKNTPKYGLIYHTHLVSSTTVKNKGKASRMLAAKAALATRFDALGEETSSELGEKHLEKLEQRLRFLDGTRRNSRLSGTVKARAKFEKYHSNQEHMQYSVSVDSTLPTKLESTTEEHRTEEKKKKTKKHSLEHAPSAGESSGTQVTVKEEADVSSKTKKKKKHSSSDSSESSGSQVEIKEEADVSLPKTKKKKKHSLERASDVGESSGTQVEVKEEADVSLSKTKEKKHSLKHTSDAGESSGTQVKVQEKEADASSKTKKKKKHSLERTSDASESITEIKVKEEEKEADVSLSKPKKKKKHSLELVGESSSSDKQEKSDDVLKKKKIEESSESMFLSPSPLVKKKKRKHSSAGESSLQEKSQEEIDSSLLSQSTEQETTMEGTDSQHEQSFGEPKKKKKKKKSKEPKA
ncbi:nucleolar protein 58 [Pseudomyrmex gracilis]|uniref:nucleolar protein 58 n=1 Tax=Pseudomyrmex gracilis TaxID=219809 RepID=UPI0009949BCD|nr:nucleolar protein 58 [Pseudomyrmex gracilis]